jgi:hypothetical protein
MISSILFKGIGDANVGPQNLDRLVPTCPLDQMLRHMSIFRGRDEPGSQ